MATFTDQTARTIILPSFPRKIISLVPSITELLADIGLDEEVTGITKFCSSPPEWKDRKTRVGGTKNIHLDIIHSLEPDLILANKEENVKEQVEACAAHYPVWVSDIETLDDACEMIQQVGLMTGRIAESEMLYTGIRENFARLIPNVPPLTVAYLIWRDPFMTVGHDTFIHHMLCCAGFDNVCKDASRYPVITMSELIERRPQVLMLSSEPYPFNLQHLEEMQQLLPATKTILVDGSMFSWYGSRLLHAPGYFHELRQGIA
jgi:ABC-type Fe3+-hydroxamate transport system substrate-binding protein